MRLNKFLSDAGVCSRRETDRLIEAGKITINGVPAMMGQKVTLHDKVFVDGKLVTVRETNQEEKVVLKCYKPVGVTCTTSKEDKDNIVDFIQYPIRVYPIGRLDKDSEGLILLTNDGSIVNGILRSRYEHEKEYVVTINQPVTDEFLTKMANGVEILDTVTKPCRIWKTGVRTFHIVITQGLNRQIRRMSEACGCRVTKLKRIRVMNIKLGKMEVGQCQLLSQEELKELLQSIQRE